MRRGCHLFHGIHRSEHIAHVGNTNQARAFAEKAFVGFKVEASAVVHRNHADNDSLAFSQKLPRNDVAMMLHDGDNHFVTFLEKGFSETAGNEVKTLCGASREEHFCRGAGIDELPHALSCRFMQVGGLLREEMHPAMHIGVGGIVFIGNGLNHAARLLRRGSVVEVYEGTAIDFPLQNGEVLADFFYVV